MIKDIDGYSGYAVTDDGNVISKRRLVKYRNGKVYTYKERKLKPLIKMGYYYVALSIESKVKHEPLHRLIGLAFIPNPENKPFINHINGNKKDNKVSNLEWCTHSENVKHAYNVLGVKGRLGSVVTNETKQKIREGLKRYFDKTTLK